MEDRGQLVVAVRAQRPDRQVQVDLRGNPDPDGTHSRDGTYNSRRAGSSSFSDHSRKPSWCSPPICTTATCVKPASRYSFTAATCAETSGPHGIEPATSSFVTNWLAPANPAGPGSSAFTFQPKPNHRNWSCARSIAASRSWS